MTMAQFDEGWNKAYDSLRHFEDRYLTFPFLFAVTSYQHVISLLYCI